MMGTALRTSSKILGEAVFGVPLFGRIDHVELDRLRRADACQCGGEPQCSVASAGAAVIQTSIFSGVRRIIGMAFGWMASTSPFALIVRSAKMSLVISLHRLHGTFFRSPFVGIGDRQRGFTSRRNEMGERIDRLRVDPRSRPKCYCVRLS